MKNKIPMENNVKNTVTRKKIELSTWNDYDIGVGLEPEGEEFILRKDDVLCFVAITESNDFVWHAKMNFDSKSIQVYPESRQKYEIEIYKNGELVW